MLKSILMFILTVVVASVGFHFKFTMANERKISENKTEIAVIKNQQNNFQKSIEGFNKNSKDLIDLIKVLYKRESQNEKTRD